VRKSKIQRFSKFFLIWYSQQFAIPFWIVGHVHLHFNNYHSVIEVLSSLLMHLLVSIGFWLDWKNYSKVEKDEEG